MVQRPVKTTRVGRTDRGAPLLVLLALAAITLAVLKPWQDGGRSTVTGENVPSAVPVSHAGATPSLSPAELAALAVRDRRQCQSEIGWRVVTMEETGGRSTRTLLLVAPVTLQASPADSRIPTAVLYAQRLFGIGYCEPAEAGPAAPPRPTVDIWRVPEKGPPVRVQDPVPLDEGLLAAGEAYYGPPAGTASEWTPGRYVFEVLARPGSPSRLPSWFALDYHLMATTAGGLPNRAP
jgi:hypothetical protein